VRAGWLVVAAALLLTGCQEDATGAGGPSPAGTADAAPALLRAAANGDGDSWKDTSGVEYRLGLVNTPELSECFGQAASRKRKQLTAAGFRATSYAVDTYGRHVAVVFLADGRNLNVWLARNGYANNKYLAEFRHENPPLAAQLDAAFAAAKQEHAGLWRACGSRGGQ
jgi:endonuclease YncB( thermonuclease family)